MEKSESIVTTRVTPFYATYSIENSSRLWIASGQRLAVSDFKFVAPNHVFVLTPGGWACVEGPIPDPPLWALEPEPEEVPAQRPSCSVVVQEKPAPKKKEPPPIDLSVRVEERVFDEIRVYKVLGDEEVLKDYLDRAFEMDGLDGQNSLQNKDWTALYTQFQAEHLLGTIPYRWQQTNREYKSATLMEITFRNLRAVVAEGPLFYDGRIPGTQKATALKTHLKLPEDCLLMPELGARGKCALVRETEEEWELIVPHNLLSSSNGLQWSERIIAKFRKHRDYPMTEDWLDFSQGSDSWRSFERDFDPSIIPDLPPPL